MSTLPTTARRRLERGVVLVAAVATISPFAGCGSEARVPDPGETGAAAVTRPVEVSGSVVGESAFGDGMTDTVAALTDRLGEPALTVGPTRFERIDGADGWYESAGDNLSPQWDHRFFSTACWDGFCVNFGGDSRADLTLRGWELAVYNRWASTGSDAGVPEPGVRTADGITLGDSWEDLHAAYPKTTVRGAEGAALGVDGAPWPTVSDGVHGWRLSGEWDYEHPEQVPPGAAVTRLSAGEGPEPGCC